MKAKVLISCAVLPHSYLRFVFTYAKRFSYNAAHVLLVMVTMYHCGMLNSYEPRHEKIGLWGFRPGPTQTGLYHDRGLLEASNLGFRKYTDCKLFICENKGDDQL